MINDDLNICYVCGNQMIFDVCLIDDDMCDDCGDEQMRSNMWQSFGEKSDREIK